MDSIYFDRPARAADRARVYRFEPPQGNTHSDVLIEAAKLTSPALTTASTAAPRRRDPAARLRSRQTLSDNRSPKQPYRS